MTTTQKDVFMLLLGVCVKSYSWCDRWRCSGLGSSAGDQPSGLQSEERSHSESTAAGTRYGNAQIRYKSNDNNQPVVLMTHYSSGSQTGVGVTPPHTQAHW